MGAIPHRFTRKTVEMAGIFRDWATQGHCVAENHWLALGIGPKTELHPLPRSCALR